MKIAFLILAHKNPEQLGELIRRLDSSSSLFYIHIDIKVDITPFKNVTKNFDNVFWVKRENGRWGDFGIVKATINALFKAQASDEISHYVLLSGQDYPLLSIEEIITFFNKNHHTSFIEYEPLPIPRLNYSGYDRINCYSFNLKNKRHTVIPLSWKPKFSLKGHLLNILLMPILFFRKKRTHPNYADPYYGSQWWVLNSDLCKEVIKFIENNPDFLSYHSSTLLPDEMFFQSIVGTIHKHSGKKEERINIENENLHFIVWNDKSNHPQTLLENDYKRMISSKKLFARKFDYINSRKLIEKLNERSE